MRILLLATLLTFVAACSSGSDDGGAGRLNVVATTTQIGDFAAQVGGDRIALTVLLKPNQEAHDFEPEPSQIRALHEADVVLINGLGLDASVEKLLASVNADTVIVSKGVVPREGGDHEEEGEEHEDEHADGEDPHVWFDVANARRMVENVRDGLTAADSENASGYAANATEYLRQLDELDRGIRSQVQQIPAACRKLITNHDVLGYYAAAYGFEVVGSVIPSVTTGAQASASDIAEVVQQIRAEGVPAIFAEASANPALINQVGREAGVKVVDDLYGDSLGPKDSDGATYIEMMQSNTRKIVDALKDC